MIISKIFSSTNSKFFNTTYVLELTNECTICSSNIVPIVVGGYNDYEMHKLYVMLYCNSCHKTFISEYYCLNDYEYRDFEMHSGVETEYVESYPLNYCKREFSDEINKISNKFGVIYNQSLEAEKRKLDMLSGMGYRKALEYLIKDYIKFYNLSGGINIDEMPLQKCIDDYIDNETLKKLTKACTWLGNDQAHYTIKHEEFTVDDIKKYLDSAVSILEGEIRSKDLMDYLLKENK